MRILFVSYPLLPVNDGSCGGAEQVLVTLERELARRGHETVIAGCVGSEAAGEVFATGVAPSAPDQVAAREREQNEGVLRFARERGFDLVHDHGGNIWQRAGELDAPVLATLHLPRSLYARETFARVPRNVFFNCVSESQSRSFCDLPNVVGVARNGIALERFPFCADKQPYVLWLGRFCAEKGPHLAIAAARAAGVRLILGGDIYRLSYHEEFFRREVRWRIDEENVQAEWRPTFARKVELLQRARAVLIPSVVDETSSLVAMEAAACGTPVIAFARGALPEIVADQETGYLVDDVGAMASAITWVEKLDPRACRREAERRFDARRMADEYERLYAKVLASAGQRAAA